MARNGTPDTQTDRPEAALSFSLGIIAQYINFSQGTTHSHHVQKLFPWLKMRRSLAIQV